MTDPYATLGVPSAATQAEIQAAWRIRSAMLHPDRFDRHTQPEQWRQAHAMFAQLKEAYAILSDTTKRAAYDQGRFRDGQMPPRQPRRGPTEQTRSGSTSKVPDPDPELVSDRFLHASQL